MNVRSLAFKSGEVDEATDSEDQKDEAVQRKPPTSLDAASTVLSYY